MTQDSVIHRHSAVPSLRRRSINSRRRDGVTIDFTSRRFVLPRARPCYQDGTIMRWDLARSLNGSVVGEATVRIGRLAPRPWRKFFGPMVTTLLPSASGI